MNFEATNRFAFGKNWQRFIGDIDERRISAAEDGLRTILKNTNLKGRTFLDVGSGSGLTSLVASRLGARVHSFDYDADSVACAQEMKRRFSSQQLTAAKHFCLFISFR